MNSFHRAMDKGREIRIPCRIIREGRCRGKAVTSPRAISFFGGVDPDTGMVVEKGHPLEGRSVAGVQLVFPGGKGSTVGSYILHRMARQGTAPLGLVLAECDSVIAAGAVIAEIPCVDRAAIDTIEDGDDVEIAGGEIIVRKGA
jgi:predicted aconitase with swiveling domain